MGRWPGCRVSPIESSIGSPCILLWAESGVGVGCYLIASNGVFTLLLRQTPFELLARGPASFAWSAWIQPDRTGGCLHPRWGSPPSAGPPGRTDESKCTCTYFILFYFILEDG